MLLIVTIHYMSLVELNGVSFLLTIKKSNCKWGATNIKKKVWNVPWLWKTVAVTVGVSSSQQNDEQGKRVCRILHNRFVFYGDNSVAFLIAILFQITTACSLFMSTHKIIMMHKYKLHIDITINECLSRGSYKLCQLEFSCSW